MDDYKALIDLLKTQAGVLGKILGLQQKINAQLEALLTQRGR